MVLDVLLGRLETRGPDVVATATVTFEGRLGIADHLPAQLLDPSPLVGGEPVLDRVDPLLVGADDSSPGELPNDLQSKLPVLVYVLPRGGPVVVLERSSETSDGAAESAEEAYADDTVLTDVLGPHAKVRILTVLIADNDCDLDPTEISRLAGIDRSTSYEHVDDLLAYGLIEQTRTVGNSPMYRIDRDSAAAEALAQMEWELLDQIEE